MTTSPWQARALSGSARFSTFILAFFIANTVPKMKATRRALILNGIQTALSIAFVVTVVAALLGISYPYNGPVAAFSFLVSFAIWAIRRSLNSAKREENSSHGAAGARV